MKKLLLLALLLTGTTYASAQQTERFPLALFEEWTDTKPHDDAAVWDKMKQAACFSWATTDVRYKKLDVPEVKQQNSIRLEGWRGERVNAQALLWTKEDLGEVKMEMSELKSGKKVIPASAVRTHFVRYVMTDELNKDGKGGCGERLNKADWDSSMVADILDAGSLLPVKARTVQPVWVNVWIPATAEPGVYRGKLSVSSEKLGKKSLTVEVRVDERTLPAPKDWKMYVDLWQNPYAIARYYQVPLWSKEHFDAMRPIMRMLADAGQRTITASIMHKPWAGQTYDHYDSMIFRMKKLDGTWAFDYTVFDKWVDFMMNDVGIDGLISCYTMVPWELSFDYYDQATNRVLFVKAKPGEQAYTDYWGTFLKDFARHLKEKGWFGKTSISMDERPLKDMQEAIKVIKEADPEYKIMLAGNYHDEIQSDLYYLCIPYGQTFPAKVKAEREKNGQISTYYTCCTEPFPNIFTFSAPAEAAWTAIHAVAGGYDGYLRWSTMSWPADPLHDSRFRTWAAGDTYCIYPGPRSSIRFERLVEGLQCCEKILILRDELVRKNARRELGKLNKLLGGFMPGSESYTHQSAADMVKELNAYVNSL